MQQPLRGVNIGGWLILEKWMTPTVFKGFEANDEYTLTQQVDGRARIQAHRDNFIQESDLQWLQSHHIDIIRVPIGHWFFKSIDNYLPQVSYVDWLMEKAARYNLKVLIDLHALEGSQNGLDHSGRIGKARWFQDRSYRQRSVTLLKDIAERYKDNPQLWGIQITNEPKFGIMHAKLRQYYRQAYTALQHILPSSTRVVFSDGFTPFLLNGALGRSKQATMDIHLYHGTKPFTKYMSLTQYYKSIARQAKWLQQLSCTQPIIIGEWSGVFRQTIFDTHPKAEHMTLIKDHIEKQLTSFSSVDAWFYWSYKTEQPGVWNFRSLVENATIDL